MCVCRVSPGNSTPGTRGRQEFEPQRLSGKGGRPVREAGREGGGGRERERREDPWYKSVLPVEYIPVSSFGDAH